MSTTTQILFNSPALHSLKRDQLVKLCKIHSLKANGKNKDLIERLQLHAKALPPDDPLSIAPRSENHDAGSIADSEDKGPDYHGGESSTRAYDMPRPSEQWEVVMDSIAEVDEDTKSTLRSNRGAPNAQAGEFGTHASKGPSLTQGIHLEGRGTFLTESDSFWRYFVSESHSNLPRPQTQYVQKRCHRVVVIL